MTHLIKIMMMALLVAGHAWAQTNGDEDVNAYNGEKTALMDALWSGNIKKIKTLLDKGADPNLLRKGGDNIIVPISMSAVNSDLTHEQVADIVKMMIDHGAKLEVKDNTYGYTPLMWMIEYNQPEAVKVLLDAGASVDVKDSHDDTPLSKASKDGRLEIVKLLMARSNNNDDAQLEKSLCNAVWQKQMDVVKSIILQVKKMPACALYQSVNGDQLDMAGVLLAAEGNTHGLDKNNL